MGETKGVDYIINNDGYAREQLENIVNRIPENSLAELMNRIGQRTSRYFREYFIEHGGELPKKENYPIEGFWALILDMEYLAGYRITSTERAAFSRMPKMPDMLLQIVWNKMDRKTGAPLDIYAHLHDNIGPSSAKKGRMVEKNRDYRGHRNTA